MANAAVTFVQCDGGAFCSPPTSITMGGTSYVSVSGLLQKTTDDNVVEYAAPLTLLYPADPADCTGNALVDLVNNSAMIVQDAETPPLGFAPPLPGATVILGADFIGRRGLVVAQLQYQGMVDPEQVQDHPVITIGQTATPRFYPQSASLPSTYGGVAVVISDAASFLRHAAGDRCASSKVYAYGVSRSAMHLRKLLAAPYGLSSFDGSLLHGLPGFALGQTAPAGPPPEGTGKTIVVNSEGDIRLIGSSAVRDVAGVADDRYRVYEVAGVAHAPGDLGFLGGRHNIVRIGPVIRRMFDLLGEWSSGAQPPPNAYLDDSGCVESPVALGSALGEEIGYLECTKGAEGAMLGGVRLPHVYSAGGGAPLGCYSGVEPLTPYALTGGAALPMFSLILSLLGVYDPSCIDLGATYPNHGSYVSKVARAARYAHSMGWIGDLDREAYVDIAAHCQVGLHSSLTFDDLLDCHGL